MGVLLIKLQWSRRLVGGNRLPSGATVPRSSTGGAITTCRPRALYRAREDDPVIIKCEPRGKSSSRAEWSKNPHCIRPEFATFYVCGGEKFNSICQQIVVNYSVILEHKGVITSLLPALPHDYFLGPWTAAPKPITVGLRARFLCHTDRTDATVRNRFLRPEHCGAFQSGASDDPTASHDERCTLASHAITVARGCSRNRNWHRYRPPRRPPAPTRRMALATQASPPVNEARWPNELLGHLGHLRETNDLFGNVAKSRSEGKSKSLLLKVPGPGMNT